MTQAIYYWQEQNMFKSPNELKDYMKEFIGEGSFSYLETHSERFFRSYQILSNYNHNFEKEILVDLASNNGIFVPAIHAISPFKQIHLIDYGEKITDPVKNFKIIFFLSLLKLLGISKIKNDELGTFLYVLCKKNRRIDLEKIDTDTRFPAPIYRY
jgi:hypothetical protein